MKLDKSNSLYLLFATIPILVFVCLVLDTVSVEAMDCGVNRFFFKAYDNRSLKGAPKYTGCTDQIDFNVNARPPVGGSGGKSESEVETDFSAIGVGRENFSIHWRGVFEFQRDVYMFFAAADDGIEVRLDDQPIISDWRDHGYKKYNHQRYVETGMHVIEIFYYQHGGGAEVEYSHYRTGQYP